ncbi:DUF1758 domain-containing protein [Trichonephila clavipes]|nr:DUF1758 domain-containing protein [Trichonephila clavipes]
MHCNEIKQSKQVKPESKEVTENTTLSNNSSAREVFLQTLIGHIKENNLKHFIRVIIDTGSQKSYITKYLAGKLKLKGLEEEIVNRGLFGGIERAETHQRYLINLANVDGNYNCQLEVLDEKKICASLPIVNDVRRLNQLKDIDLWNLDTLSIKYCSENLSKTETQELALNYFRETLDQDSTGRYKVNLPWLEGHPPLPDNKQLAQKRLKNTVKSLKLANRLNEYQEVFNQWEREGIIEPIHGENDIPESLDVHYLPHRAVFKDNSTTKVRPVFDGSAKMRNFVSINECIVKGPNLIEMIPSILNRFRWGKIGVIEIYKTGIFTNSPKGVGQRFFEVHVMEGRRSPKDSHL